MDTVCNCLALRQATRRVTQFYDEALAPSGLRGTQFSLLSLIEGLGPVAMNVLADAMVMDRATLGHNLRPLEAAGLLKLRVGQDRRSREVTLTKDGHAALAQAKQHWRRAQAAFEKAFGRADAAALRAALQKAATTEFRLG